MSRKLEIWGAICTAVYLLVITVVVGYKFNDFVSLKLNELGDFLAGAFGPVAFLWLVLGFLQQGRELKLSTDALQLQAEELKNSVEQQSIMASAALQQIAGQQAALALQQKELEDSISPVFRFSSGSRSGGEGTGIKTSMQLFNEGHEARDVLVTFNPPIGDTEVQQFGKISKGAISSAIEFLFDKAITADKGICTVMYLREDGRRILETFQYLIPSDNPFVFVDRTIPFVRGVVE